MMNEELNKLYLDFLFADTVKDIMNINKKLLDFEIAKGDLDDNDVNFFRTEIDKKLIIIFDRNK